MAPLPVISKLQLAISMHSTLSGLGKQGSDTRGVGIQAPPELEQQSCENHRNMRFSFSGLFVGCRSGKSVAECRPSACSILTNLLGCFSEQPTRHLLLKSMPGRTIAKS